jgi:hypothetical protein
MDAATSSGGPVLLPVPSHCPGCCAAWDENAACPKCGLTRTEIAGILRAGCAAYERAREDALRGHFDAAAGHLADLARFGLPELTAHPAVRRLRELLSGAVRQAVPEAVAAEYDAARRAAAENDWSSAALHAANAARVAPDSLPVLKLHALCLHGAGREAAAERLRRDLLRAYPDDTDLPRWRFAPERSPRRERLRRAPRAAPRRRSATPLVNTPGVSAPVASVHVPIDLPAPPKMPRMQRWGPGLALAGCLLGLAGLVTALVGIQRPALEPLSAPSVSIVTASPTPVPSASPMPIADRAIPKINMASNPGGEDGIVPLRLQREWGQTRRAADEQQARRWFNSALSARRAGDWETAERYAAAAAEVGKDTYLYEDALLLRARCADNLKRADSAQQYARLADERPRSDYAPAALVLAAKAARRHGDTARADAYIRRLRQEYPRTPEAMRAAR